MNKPQASDTKTKLDRITIVRPGGNETAFIWDQIPRNRQGVVSQSLLSQYPHRRTGNVYRKTK